MRAEPVDVLHVVPNFHVGGVERHLLARIPLIRERGLRIGVCGLGPGDLLDAYRTAGIPAADCGMRGLWDVPAGLVRFAAHVRALRPRVVCSHLFWSDLAVALTRGASREAAWISVKHDEGRWMSAPTRTVEQWMLARTDAVVVDSLGVQRARAEIVPGGPAPRLVYLSAPDPGEAGPGERERAREAVGIPQEATAFGVVARLHPVKGHDVLLDAWRRVEERAPGAHLVLVGDGPEAGRLQAIARTVGDPARVRFLGLRHDMENVYRALDAVVLPSRSEGFPLTILEAMSFGLAVIASRVGGVGEAVEDGRTGLLVPPGDATALAAALCALAEDDVRRRAMGRAGRAAYRERFTPEREVAALLALYRSFGVNSR